MKDVLNENLMILLLKVQPPKSRMRADYTVPHPVAAVCGGSTCTKQCGNNCTVGCKGSCAGSCTRSCQRNVR
jgi:modification target Cys-rich repeat protein